MPHDHQHVLADWHKASPQARRSRRSPRRASARADWANWAWEDRAAVFLKAAELLATTWRQTLNAATMLGQSKTAFQAEIDAACELIDFWRFNPAYAQELYDEQPLSNNTMWNQLDYRPLEGFVYAVTPFNFTSIGGNLPTAPALMGNTVIWKPASTAMLSAYYIMKLLEEAGLPPGVINFVPGDAAEISNVAAVAPRSRGRALHRQHGRLQQHVEDDRREHVAATRPIRASSARRAARTSSSRIRRPIRRRSPSPSRAAGSSTRDRSARRRAASTSRARSGRKCAIAPSAMMEDMKMGDITDFRNFIGAVIDEKAFKKISEYLDDATQERERSSPAASRRARRATSSSRRSSRRRIPTIACSARRSSDRS